MQLKWFGCNGKIGFPGFVLCGIGTIIVVIIVMFMLIGFYDQIALKFLGRKAEADILKKYIVKIVDRNDYYIVYSFKGVKFPEETVKTYKESVKISEKLFNKFEEGSKIQVKYLTKNPEISSLNPKLFWAIVLLYFCVAISSGIVIGYISLIKYLIRYNKMVKQGESINAEIKKIWITENKSDDNYTFYYHAEFSFEYDHEVRCLDKTINKRLYNSFEKNKNTELLVLPDLDKNILYVSFPENKKNHMFG